MNYCKTFFFCQIHFHIFDNFNNIYYCFLLFGTAIENRHGKWLNKKSFATNQLIKILIEFWKMAAFLLSVL